MQTTVAIEQPDPATEDASGLAVCFDNPPQRVQMDNSDSGVFQQIRQSATRGIGASHRLADSDELADVGQKAPDELQSRGVPSRPA